MEYGTKFYEPDLGREFTGLSVLEGQIVKAAFDDFMNVRGPLIADRVAALRTSIRNLEAMPAGADSQKDLRKRLIDELVEHEGFQYRASHFAHFLNRGVGMLSDDFYREHLYEQYVGLPISAASLVVSSLQSFRQRMGSTRAAQLVGVAERRLVAFELCLDREARVHAAISDRLDDLCASIARRSDVAPSVLRSGLAHGREPVEHSLDAFAESAHMPLPQTSRVEAQFIDELTDGLATARELRRARGHDFWVHPGQAPAHAPENVLLDAVLRAAVQRRTVAGAVRDAASAALIDFASAQPIRPIGDTRSL